MFHKKNKSVVINIKKLVITSENAGNVLNEIAEAVHGVCTNEQKSKPLSQAWTIDGQPFKIEILKDAFTGEEFKVRTLMPDECNPENQKAKIARQIHQAVSALNQMIAEAEKQNLQVTIDNSDGWAKETRKVWVRVFETTNY